MLTDACLLNWYKYGSVDDQGVIDDPDPIVVIGLLFPDSYPAEFVSGLDVVSTFFASLLLWTLNKDLGFHTNLAIG